MFHNSGFDRDNIHSDVTFTLWTFKVQRLKVSLFVTLLYRNDLFGAFFESVYRVSHSRNEVKIATFPENQLFAGWTICLHPFQALPALVLACLWAGPLENVDFIEIQAAKA
jgi:hypothetical protein